MQEKKTIKLSWAAAAAGEGPSRPAPTRLRYQMYDDLTKTNFKKMKAIGDDKRVDQCWSTNGQLKFKLVGSPTVKTVKSVFDSIDDNHYQMNKTILLHSMAVIT